jgi:hypothetical protein
MNIIQDEGGLSPWYTASVGWDITLAKRIQILEIKPE